MTTIDPQARKFLETNGDGPIQVVGSMDNSHKDNDITRARAAYVQEEFLTRADRLMRSMMGHFVERRQSASYSDEECIAAIALFTINMRAAYGTPQTPREKQSWTAEMAQQRLEAFDALCETMQEYYDSNASK